MSDETTELGKIMRSAPPGRTLSALSRALSRQIEEITASADLSADHWYVLDLIVKNDGIAMNDLARHLSIPAPTVTKLADRLVTKAFVFRLADRADRRRVLVHASRRGADAHSSLSGQVEQIEEEYLRKLASQEHEGVRALLAALQ